MAKSYTAIKQEAIIIRDEVNDGANTAERVGTAILDTLDFANENTGGSVSSNITPCYLSVIVNTLYLHAPKGSLRTTDTPVFMRKRTTKHNTSAQRGWREPRLGNANHIPTEMVLNRGLSTDQEDVFLIKPTQYPTFNDYGTDAIYEILDWLNGGKSGTVLMVNICRKQCGIAIKRNGKFITDIMPFHASGGNIVELDDVYRWDAESSPVKITI